MEKLRLQIVIVVLALVAIAALIFSQQPPTLPGQAPVVAPLSGGVYTEALIGSLGRLNPLLDAYNQADHDVNRLIYSRMIEFDHRGLPQGDLVESWGISVDGKTYSFSIRENAYWHDGEPVLSDDIVFTIEMMRDEQSPLPEDLRNFWGQVEVYALDEKTLQFVLPEPFAPFLDYLTFGVLPAHLWDGMTIQEMIVSELNLQPVGSGPYHLQSVNVEGGAIRSLTLAANPGYYLQPPFVEQVVFRYFPDAISAMDAYQRGEVMGISQISAQALPQALKEPNLDLFTGRLPRLTMVMFNLGAQDLPFFQDVNVRKALLMSVNRRYIVDRILGGQAIIAHSPIFPESWAYYDGVAQASYDPDQALALLRRAGYAIPAEGGNVREKDGLPLSFELVYPGSEPYESIASHMQQQWARLGVQVRLRAVPSDDLLNEYLEPRRFQAALFELNLARSPDPDLYPFWHQAQTVSGQNYAGWDDRQVSEYLEQARIEVDLAERIRLYRNFQVRFANDMPALLLYYPVYTYAVSNQVKGVSMGPLYDPSDRFNLIRNWFLLIGPAGETTEQDN
jgi:peptide/nickel transport system substrate-binding protein